MNNIDDLVRNSLESYSRKLMAAPLAMGMPQRQGFAQGGTPGGVLPGPVNPGGGDNMTAPVQSGEYIIPVDAIIAKGRELAPGSQLSDEDAHSIGKLFFDQETTKLKQSAGNPVPPRNAGVQVGMPQGFAEGGMSLNDQATAPIGIPPVVQPTAPPTPTAVQPGIGSGLFLGAPGTPTVQSPPRPGYDEGGLVVDDKIDRPENRFEPAIGMPSIPSSESMRTGGIDNLTPAPVPKAPVTHDIADPNHLANADNTRAIAIQQAAGGQGNVPAEMLPTQLQPNSPLNPANHPSAGVGAPGIGLGGNKGITLTPSTTDMSTNPDGSFKMPHAPPAPGTGIMQVEGQKAMDVGNMGPTQGVGGVGGIDVKTGMPQGMSKNPIGYTPEGAAVYMLGGKKVHQGVNGWEETPVGTKVGKIGILKEGVISQLTPEAKRDMALQYAKTGQMPPLGMGASAVADRDAIYNEWSSILRNKGTSIDDLAEHQAVLKASKTALTNDTKQYDLMRKAELQAAGAAKLLRESSKNYDRTGIRFVNSMEALAKNATTDPKLADLQMKLLSFSREYYKVTTNAYASATELSVGAQAQADKLLSTSDSYASLEAKIKAAEQEMANTGKTFSQTITDRKKEIHDTGSPASPPPDSPVGMPQGNDKVSVAAHRIKSDLGNGFNREQIYHALRDNGHSKEEAEAAFRIADGGK
jgi:hypothetical protein